MYLSISHVPCDGISDNPYIPLPSVRLPDTSKLYPFSVFVKELVLKADTLVVVNVVSNGG
jgi:hypothetical protein